MEKKIIGIVGSLRAKSFNKSLMEAAVEHAPEGMNIEIASIADFPLFNQDKEVDYPVVVQEVKDKIKNADGVLIATPEYNRTIPGVLKNAIDWLSRPSGTAPFAEKPVYVIGASFGQVGAAVAQYNLKQALLFLNARVMGQPEFYTPFAGEKVDESGKLTDEKTIQFLEEALQKFQAFCEKN